MPTASQATVAFRSARPSDVDADVLFVPIFEGEHLPTAVAGLDENTGGAVSRASHSGEFQGRPYELFLTPLFGGWRAARVGLIGAGKAKDFDTERLRKLAA